MSGVTRRQVLACVRRWKKRLGLGVRKIEVQFGVFDDCTHGCEASPEYREAVLYFNLAKMTPTDLDREVVHELTHYLTQPLANCAHSLARGDKAVEEWVRTEEETLTTRLEDLLLQLQGQ